MIKKLGVVILNYNTYEETIRCVESICTYVKCHYSIYIVDNCSSDGSGERLVGFFAQYKDVEVLQNIKNTGYSAGNNVGIKKAEKDGCAYIAIVNSDVELLNDAFTLMIDTLENDPSVLMVGPSVVDNNGRESQIPRKKLTFRTFVLDRHPFCDLLHRGRTGDRYYTVSNRGVTTFDGSVSGCCFVVKMEDFKSIDYFDENVFLYYEEDILAYKMASIQRKAAVNMDAKVWHKANVSTNKRGNAFVQFHRWTSVLYLLKEYARISKPKQIAVALWNTVTWDALSLKSSEYRSRNAAFRKKNWSIVSDK